MATEPQYVRPQLHRGMDHGHYDYRPLNSSRQPLRWPDDCRVALCVVVSLDIMEWTAPSDGYQLPSLAGGYGPSPHPDVTRWSHREYAGEGGMCALPMTLPIDDVAALWDRRVSMSRYVSMIKETFDTLHEEGASNGRLIALNLRPWLSGQPFRVRYLNEALGYILGHEGVWRATGSEIIDWYEAKRST